MSFSSDVKTELCHTGPDKPCCARAEAYGILLYCNTFSAVEVRIITENPNFAGRLPKLFQRAFGLQFDKRPEQIGQGQGKMIFQITERKKLDRIINLLGYDPLQNLVLHINFGLLEENCCRGAFLRGCFFAGGSAIDPLKRYHLELATSHAQASRELLALLTDMGRQPGQTARNGSHVTYFKNSEQIEELLTLMGAPVSAMELMNAKAEKDLRGGVNRRVNCDAANLDKAVEAVSKAIRRGRLGLKDPRRPVGCFLFLGPSGVGKTQLCRSLAGALFGSEEALLRFDMSEYMEAHTVSRLIGSPPGYVGHEEGGQLTERVRRKPWSVVLLDELEKAHHDIWSLLLQVMEEGVLTDAQGRTVNFENTVIVMTSNAGSTTGSTGAVGFGRSETEQGKAKAMKALEGFLRPEFINRVDEIVYFNRLTEDNFKAIAQIMLKELTQNLREKGIVFTYGEDLMDYLVKKSYSQVYGARNLRRQIQKDLEDPIATKIIDSYLEPISKINITSDGETLTVHAE